MALVGLHDSSLQVDWFCLCWCVYSLNGEWDYRLLDDNFSQIQQPWIQTMNNDCCISKMASSLHLVRYVLVEIEYCYFNAEFLKYLLTSVSFIRSSSERWPNKLGKSVRPYVRTSTIKHNAATNQIMVFVKVDETFTMIWLSRSSEVRVKVIWDLKFQ